MNTKIGLEKYRTVEWIADYLQFHPETIRKMAREKRIPATRVGRVWRFQESVIKEWMQGKRAD